MTLSVLLCIGAGRGTARPPADRLILTETDPVLSQDLARTHADTDLVTVYNVAMTDRTGSDAAMVLHQAALPELSAMRKPTGLRELFPNLGVTEAEPVAAVTPADLVVACHLNPSESAMLMVDHPADALMVVRALLEQDLLKRFARLWLRTGHVELYDGSGTVEDIRTLLEGAGYDTLLRVDEDPDFPVLEAMPSPGRVAAAARLARLAEDLSENGARLETLREEYDTARREHEAALEALSGERDAALAEATELREDLDRRAAEYDAVQADLRTLQDESADAQEALTGQIATVTEQLDARNTDLDRAREENATARTVHAAALKALQGERDTARAEAKKLHEDSTKTREDLTRQIADLKTQVASLDQEVTILTKRAALVSPLTKNISRAEGQLDLIQDLLLERPRL